MTAVEAHEALLLHRLETGLADIEEVTSHGARDRRRTPTVLFSVGGHTSATVFHTLAEQGVNAPAGSFYALECSRWLGLGDAGAVRAGIAPYTDDSDVDRLLAAVAKIAAGPAD
jgi:selenocysteine lyase/cysteine desulfurase